MAQPRNEKRLSPNEQATREMIANRRRRARRKEHQKLRRIFANSALMPFSKFQIRGRRHGFAAKVSRREDASRL